MTATDGRTATKRLAKAILGKQGDISLPLITAIGAKVLAVHLAAQGFGHQEDTLQAFVVWVSWNCKPRWWAKRPYENMVAGYLASLAAKEEEG